MSLDNLSVLVNTRAMGILVFTGPGNKFKIIVERVHVLNRADIKRQASVSRYQKVFTNNRKEGFALVFLPVSCISIARQINKVPAFIDQEMIDELGFPGCGGCFCQVFYY